MIGVFSFAHPQFTAHDVQPCRQWSPIRGNSWQSIKINPLQQVDYARDNPNYTTSKIYKTLIDADDLGKKQEEKNPLNPEIETAVHNPFSAVEWCWLGSNFDTLTKSSERVNPAKCAVQSVFHVTLHYTLNVSSNTQSKAFSVWGWRD